MVSFSWQDWHDHVMVAHVRSQHQAEIFTKAIKEEPGEDVDVGVGVGDGNGVADVPELGIKIVDVRSLSKDSGDVLVSGMVEFVFLVN